VLAWFDQLAQYKTLVWWLAALSSVVFVGGLVAIPWVIVRLPADYFAHRRPPRRRWQTVHPGLRMSLLTVKNLAGALLLLAGLAMIVTPGPGIIAMLVGLSLVDLPGKRELERRIVRQPRVFSALNRVRFRYGRPPFDYPAM
jgi:hypothetical protein